MSNSYRADDPRAQRAEQRAYAKNVQGGRKRIASVVAGEVQGQQAGLQADKRLMFGRLGLASRMAKSQHGYRMASLANQGRMTGLRERNLGFREGAFSDKMKAGHKDIMLATLMGGAGSLGSYYIGQQQKGKLAAANAKQEERYRNTQLQMDENQGILRALLAGRSLGSSTHLRGGL